MKYYVTTDIIREADERESAMIGVSGAGIHVCNLSVEVEADDGKEALHLGREIIHAHLKSGYQDIDGSYGYILADDARKMGDAATYEIQLQNGKVLLDSWD